MTIYGYVLEEISRVSLNLNKQWIVAISLKKEREIMPADGNPSSIYGFTWELSGEGPNLTRWLVKSFCFLLKDFFSPCFFLLVFFPIILSTNLLWYFPTLYKKSSFSKSFMCMLAADLCTVGQNNKGFCTSLGIMWLTETEVMVSPLCLMCGST